MKTQIGIAAMVSIGLSALVNGQGVPASQSPGPQMQPKQQQKNKPVPVQGSPKPGSAGSGGGMKAEGVGRKGQNQTQGQTNAAKAKVGHADANVTNRSYTDALRKYRRERHDRNWWKQHFTVIVLVGGGYYYWDGGYWCPAWGYDPTYETYDYDGPIFTYGNLLPDQVIVNVQKALKQLGYYAGGLTGSLGPSTRQALANYQQDAGLEVTGAIDAATVEALGLY